MGIVLFGVESKCIGHIWGLLGYYIKYLLSCIIETSKCDSSGESFELVGLLIGFIKNEGLPEFVVVVFSDCTAY